jgi:hypothetical protein
MNPPAASCVTGPHSEFVFGAECSHRSAPHDKMILRSIPSTPKSVRFGIASQRYAHGFRSHVPLLTPKCRMRILGHSWTRRKSGICPAKPEGSKPTKGCSTENASTLIVILLCSFPPRFPHGTFCGTPHSSLEERAESVAPRCLAQSNAAATCERGQVRAAPVGRSCNSLRESDEQTTSQLSIADDTAVTICSSLRGRSRCALIPSVKSAQSAATAASDGTRGR